MTKIGMKMLTALIVNALKVATMMSLMRDYMPDEYAGTYAHDVAGMSDDDIDAALDGEPEAYWNID
jgi:hypothetical protein